MMTVRLLNATQRLKRTPDKLRVSRLDERGNATIEFALIMPLLLTLGLYGTELAYMASVRTEVGELASAVADNASRLGQTDNSGVTPSITEADINSLMSGAKEQGSTYKFADRGRLILTSLEQDPSSKKQWIHWQRCMGSLNKTSAYGNETNKNGLSGTAITGMGNSRVTATESSPVMFVEVYYNYQPLFGSMYVSSVMFKQESAFQVRDDRNLTPGITGTGAKYNCQ